MHTEKRPCNRTFVEGYAFLLLSVSLAIHSLVLHADSQAKWKMSPYLFPLVIAAFLFLLSLSLLQEGKRESHATGGEKVSSDGTEVGNNRYADIHEASAGLISHGKTGYRRREYHAMPLVALLMQQNWKDALFFALITLVYIFGITVIGFVVSTALFLAVSFVCLRERRVWLVIALSIAFPLIVYVLFGMVLHVMLP